MASVLVASEAAIYGRYGFGPATAKARWRLDVARTSFVESSIGQVRVVEADVVRPLVAELYERAQRRSIGSIARTDGWWRGGLGPNEVSAESQRRWHVVHLPHDSARPDGLLTYVTQSEWAAGRPQSRLVVQDLVAATDEAETALVQYACRVDFLASVELTQAPGWSIQTQLGDPRAAQPDEIVDGMWVRLLDVPAALAARRYGVDGELAIDVRDEQGLTGGRWRLTVVDGEAAVEPSSATADLTIAVADLGSLWLGGDVGVPSVAGLVRAGRAAAAPEVVRLASALFGCATPPFNLTHF